MSANAYALIDCVERKFEPSYGLSISEDPSFGSKSCVAVGRRVRSIPPYDSKAASEDEVRAQLALLKERYQACQERP